MFSNVLIASDGTKASTNAAIQAKQLGFLKDCAPHILAVYHLDSWNQALFSDLDGQKALIEKNLSEQLDSLAKTLTEAGTAPKAQHVKEGSIVETVDALCQSESIDLIVLGRHDYGFAKRLFGVGVSVEALQKLQRSLLIVPEQSQDSRALKTILVPVDFSQSSLDALKVARKLAVAHEAELVLFHCVPFADYVPAGTLESTVVLSVALGDAQKKVSGEAKKRLQALVDEMNEAGEKARFIVGNQSVVPGILEEADGCSASLIVLSSHGRSGFQKLFYGSVAESLIGRSEIPLLVIPAKES